MISNTKPPPLSSEMKKGAKSTDRLLSRDGFREGVFARDEHRCVVCGELGQDAHHILERRLFEDGGYYLSNGATLCGKHHIEAEHTLLTVEHIRELAGITAPALPGHFYSDANYDKWGNVILGDGRRAKGELFHDASVQKSLHSGGVLNEFSDYVKYPRTFHLPWSPGATTDDRMLTDIGSFVGQDVVVTEKMDGENTTIYPNYYHARSIDSKSHPSQDWGRAFAARIGHDIPPGWRVCAENLYAKHSIEYDNLSSYLQVFSIWDDNNKCLSWGATCEWSQLIGIETVPVLYRGVWNEKTIKSLFDPKANTEGYVVRLSRSFHFSEFRSVIAKFVRKGHVQSGHHWKSRSVVPNGLGNVLPLGGGMGDA